MPDTSNEEARRRLVASIEANGVRDPRVLQALTAVPREGFVSTALAEYAYEDTPLPIGAGQTISQPYVVALMAEHLELQPEDRVLEVGTGSGYAAAVFSRLVDEVYTIERYPELAEEAERRLWALGYRNVQVLAGDGTRGWPDEAPFDAIAVAAGGPTVPRSLKGQLAVGGRLVMPVGSTPRTQSLLRVRRVSERDYQEEDLGAVRFVPLVGEEGWGPEHSEYPETWRRPVEEVVQTSAEAFGSVEEADLGALLDRIGDARVVLLGEASHGTSEFYRMRARITEALVEKKGFTMVCAEADWPDAARIDHYVRHLDVPRAEWEAFARFPTWMWRNEEMRGLVDRLHEINAGRSPEARAAFRGLDLYSMYTSVQEVVRYLEDVDPEAATVARERYGCLTPWEGDPAAYGRAATLGRFQTCEEDAVAILGALHERRAPTLGPDGDRLLDALNNARLVRGAEQYYRAMYRGGRQSWNIRDSHMFETLDALLGAGGPEAKAVVWAHNSHLGNARATEMGRRGEHNLGQLCKEAWGNLVYSIGFGTHTGTVAAADHWDGPVKIKVVRPSHTDSYERIMHDTRLPGFFLPLTSGPARRRLMEPRLERAIGVIYRPQTELASHYFQAVLPEQFDEYVWIDETEAVRPLKTEEMAGVPETYPFGV